MCTAVLSIQPGLPGLLAGVRDELTARAWEPPGRHWPAFPGLIGGRDLQAGGTWLAVSPQERRAACVLNGIGQTAPPETRRSRGELPLRAAAGLALDRSALADLDPFRLLTSSADAAVLQSWDGRALTEQELGPGLHFIVNSGLACDLTGAHRSGARQAGAEPPNGRAHELARIQHFAPLFAEARRPEPHSGQDSRQAWDAWLPLVNGDGIGPYDERALIVRRDLPDGRIWGTTSISLISLDAADVRYDFTASPGEPSAWYSVL
jgi:uncharacterized protein with NRDE domain